MQVTPSNNLLNALSGLQANRRPPAAAGAASFQAAVQQSSGASGTQASQAAGTVQLKAVTNSPVPPVNSVASQPIQAQPRRASFLGQNLDITV